MKTIYFRKLFVAFMAMGTLFTAVTQSVRAQTPVGDEATLQNDINLGQTNFVLTGNIAVTTPIFIGTAGAQTITINGAGNTFSGSSQIFFVQTGSLALSDATLSGAATGGNGGSGQWSGGGALGAGGAIYVGSGATVTLTTTSLTGNSATGGNGGLLAGNGSGGGGGLNGGNGGPGGGNAGGGGGGNAGSGGSASGTGGGGGGLASPGSNAGGGNGGSGGGPNGGAGGNTIATNGGNGLQNSGGGGGGGGGGITIGGNGGSGGTNGGGGGGADEGGAGGAGGKYGGGGGDGLLPNGGNGGFGGGGGGGGFTAGGAGGFGAGGGAAVTGGPGGPGGVGAGQGGSGGVAVGGGGAGLGGAIFVEAGGTLIFNGQAATAGNSATGGTGNNNGVGVGSDLFLMTGTTTTLAPGTGIQETFTGTIADDSVSGIPTGFDFTPGTGAGAAIVIGNASAPGGTVQFNGANTYAGGTTITNGTTFVAGNVQALGTGAIAVNDGTLTMGNGNHLIIAPAYSQLATGNLLLNVAGVGQAAIADEIGITNTSANQVDLNGKLEVNLGSFVKTPGGTKYTFTLVDASGGYDGKFAQFDPMNLGGGLFASLQYTTYTVLLNLVTEFPTQGLSPNEQGVLQPINNYLARGGTNAAFTQLITALTPYAGSPATLGPVLDQLSPIKFNSFASTTAFNNESFETQNEDTYLAGLRTGPHGTFVGGNGSIDSSGLTVNDPNVDPALQLVHSRLLAWNAPSGLADTASPLLGGVDMKEMKSTDFKNMPPQNPWNVYVRGNVILAQGFSQADVPHFDDNTESVYVGADYRLTPNFLIGLVAGYAHTDVTLGTTNSSATVDSYSPGIYAAYANNGWYANFQGRYSYNSYTEARNIGFLGQTANGAPTGNEGVADLDGGYEFHSGALTYGPLAGVQYTHLTVNHFDETGSVGDLSVQEDQSDSLRSRLGASLRYAICTQTMCLTPHLSAAWQHEFMDQSRGITSAFSDFGGGSFIVRTPTTSQDSALVDAGLDAQINKNVTVFGDYLLQAGQDNYFGQEVQAGVKVNF